jgi:MFS superfamily sulfate permease-like transporter
MAGILQSIFVLLLSFFLLTYFKYLPLPIVAAVIVIVAIRMVDHHHIVRFWKMDKTVFFLTFFVAAICVLAEPTSGIVVRMVLALLMFSDMTSRIHSELVMTDDDGSKKFVSDKEIQVGEVEKSKRERKKQHLKELKSAAADEDVRTHFLVPAPPRHRLARHSTAVFMVACSKRPSPSCPARRYTRARTPPCTVSPASSPTSTASPTRSTSSRPHLHYCGVRCSPHRCDPSPLFAGVC